jgi:hypothetical protein
MREYMQARYDEFLKEAEIDRLLKRSAQSKSHQEMFYTKALALFGRKLVNWGERLERRYDPAPAGEAIK